MAANVDAAILNVAYDALDPKQYKLLVIPADYVMDDKSAAAIRAYVHDGGTAIMTAMSAKADEHSQWFDMPLSDVFGIRTAQFYRAADMPEMALAGLTAKATLSFYEVLEPHTARVLARFTNLPEHSPAITENDFGKGHAIYLATPAEASMLGPLLESLYAKVGVAQGPATPAGVYARVVEGRTLYVNTTEKAQTIAIPGQKHGVLTGKLYRDTLVLEPFQVDLVE
jgi:beta-galactosidase